MNSMTANSLVLVIDDDPMFHRIISVVLQDQGYACRCVTSVDQIDDSFKEVACILLDCDLDGQDGIAFLGQLGERFPHTAVVLITGSNRPAELAVRGIRAGAFDFITKPN